MVINALKKGMLLHCLFAIALMTQAQVPSGYYDGATGKSGKNLKTAFFHIVSKHTARSYKQLWTDFKSTDLRPDGKIWDMYSDMTNYIPGKDQAGQYTQEGDAYNREHSFPKSWFNDAKPMYTDLFHLYPTDGWVNGMRSNYPFGETKKPSKYSHNKHSKLGPCSTPGYNGTVFEPHDDYKGDFARTYFYMATAYEDLISNWNSPMLAGNAYPAYASWAIDMLLRWAKEDPVDQKERDRNNAVYKIQHNRNPYIDFPGLEQYVWGNQKNTTFDPNNYEGNPGGGGGEVNPDPKPDTHEVAKPVFSMASGAVAPGTEICISTTTPGAYIYYTVNNGSLQSGYAPVTYTVNEDARITAYAMLKESKSESVTETYTISERPVEGEKVFVKVNSTSDITNGVHYLIVCEGQHVAMGGYLEKSSNKIDPTVRGGYPVTIADEHISTILEDENSPIEFTLSGTASSCTFYDAVNQGYLAITNDDNKLQTLAKNTTDETKWTVSITGGEYEIRSIKYPNREIRYNSGSPRFATYKHSQQLVVLYKESKPTDIEYVEVDRGTVDVYTLDGRMVRNDVRKEEALNGLPQGTYIVGGVKLIIK